MKTILLAVTMIFLSVLIGGFLLGNEFIHPQSNDSQSNEESTSIRPTPVVTANTSLSPSNSTLSNQPRIFATIDTSLPNYNISNTKLIELNISKCTMLFFTPGEEISIPYQDFLAFSYR
jgi:hypothetical protein